VLKICTYMITWLRYSFFKINFWNIYFSQIYSMTMHSKFRQQHCNAFRPKHLITWRDSNLESTVLEAGNDDHYATPILLRYSSSVTKSAIFGQTAHEIKMDFKNEIGNRICNLKMVCTYAKATGLYRIGFIRCYRVRNRKWHVFGFESFD
jgi:hypothetical protein